MCSLFKNQFVSSLKVSPIQYKKSINAYVVKVSFSLVILIGIEGPLLLIALGGGVLLGSRLEDCWWSLHGFGSVVELCWLCRHLMLWGWDEGLGSSWRAIFFILVIFIRLVLPLLLRLLLLRVESLTTHIQITIWLWRVLLVMSLLGIVLLKRLLALITLLLIILLLLLALVRQLLLIVLKSSLLLLLPLFSLLLRLLTLIMLLLLLLFVIVVVVELLLAHLVSGTIIILSLWLCTWSLIVVLISLQSAIAICELLLLWLLLSVFLLLILLLLLVLVIALVSFLLRLVIPSRNVSLIDTRYQRRNLHRLLCL